jgi:hypothetical protein
VNTCAACIKPWEIVMAEEIVPSDDPFRSTGMADELPGLAEWTDQHSGPLTTAEEDQMWAEYMERRELEALQPCTSAKIAAGNIRAVDAVIALMK